MNKLFFLHSPHDSLVCMRVNTHDGLTHHNIYDGFIGKTPHDGSRGCLHARRFGEGCPCVAQGRPLRRRLCCEEGCHEEEDGMDPDEESYAREEGGPQEEEEEEEEEEGVEEGEWSHGPGALIDTVPGGFHINSHYCIDISPSSFRNELEVISAIPDRLSGLVSHTNITGGESSEQNFV
jgi:hypothetical protein